MVDLDALRRAGEQTRRAKGTTWAGPSGFKFMETAPRDGTFIRLRFRPGFGRDDLEAIGQWQKHEEMPAGGSWFDHDGNYIAPGPLFWAHVHQQETIRK